MLPVGIELKFSEGERPQSYALDRPDTGSGIPWTLDTFISLHCQVEFGVERRQVVFRFSPIDRKKV